MRVCVFGSSSKNTSTHFVAESKRLGEELAKRGMLCVNGGGRWGVMGGLNDGVQEHDGAVRGVIHQMFCVDSCEHPHISDMITVNGSDLWERKQLLLDHGDCVIVMPGGVGTFDELWESVSGKSLGMKGMEGKPIVVVNIDGFYDGFIQQLKRASDDGILYGTCESYFHVETDVIAALDYCVDYLKTHGQANIDEKRIKLRDPLSSSTDNKPIESTVTVLTSNDSLWSLNNLTVLSVGVALGVLLTKAVFSGHCRR